MLITVVNNACHDRGQLKMCIRDSPYNMPTGTAAPQTDATAPAESAPATEAPATETPAPAAE